MRIHHNHKVMDPNLGASGSNATQQPQASTSHAAPASTAAATAAPAAPSTSKTVVIKLGTSSILSTSTFHPKLSILSSIVETAVQLRARGHRVVLVCSGAIGMGRLRMGIKEKPKTLGERQALAALGQLRLIALWDSLFAQVGIDVAQVLLTRNDIADRPRYVNARTTLSTLLSPPFNGIPIVNENDTVSVSELRFGDNDTLSAITAGLVDADFLFLCTDVDGLYTGNPRTDPRARRLGVVRSVGEARSAVNVETQGTDFGTGGMQTKLIAAELATAAGVATVILNGETPSNILSIVEAGLPASFTAASAAAAATAATGGAAPSKALEVTAQTDDLASSSLLPDSLASSIASLSAEEASLIGHPPLNDPPHTLFLPRESPLNQRKWSLLHALHPAGTIYIDEGAYRRITKPDSGGRLLPAGVLGVEGTWERMQAVRIVVRRQAKGVEGAAQQNEEGSSSTSAAAAGKAAAALPRTLKTMLSSGRSTPDPAASDPQAQSHPTTTSAVLATSSSTPDVPSTPLESWQLLEVGRGLANYNSIDCDRIKGSKSSLIFDILGHADSDYVSEGIALHAVPTELEIGVAAGGGK